MAALDHPATGGDRRGRNNFHLWRGLSNSVAEDKTRGFFHAQHPGGDLTIFQSLCHAMIWALVLLPDAHIRPFAAPPMDAGEVGERSSLRQQDGIQVIGLHQTPRLFLTLTPLLPRNGLGL